MLNPDQMLKLTPVQSNYTMELDANFVLGWNEMTTQTALFLRDKILSKSKSSYGSFSLGMMTNSL